jgi:hypothetical protein
MKISIRLKKAFCVVNFLFFCFSSQVNSASLTPLSDTLLRSFLEPVSFTRSGISTFLTTVFNKHEYAQDFLPYDFRHFLQLLSMADKTIDPEAYANELFRLWSEKCKELLFISADTVVAVLEELPQITKNSVKKTNKEQRKKAVAKCIESALMARFAQLKSDPQLFLDELAEEILDTVAYSDELVVFLESLLNKVLWSEEDNSLLFESIQKIDSLLYGLYFPRQIVDSVGFYRIANSFLCRLKYYIDLAGGELSPAFYKKTYQAALDKSLHILQVEEAEEEIVTRAEFMKEFIIKGQLCSLAQVSGIASGLRHF